MQQTIASLAMPELANVNITGFTGSKLLRSGQVAAFDKNGVLTNQAQISALAVQAATDWYRWNLHGVDARYQGIVPWIIDGMVDLVEWEHTDERVSTRVQRGPWMDSFDPILLPSCQGVTKTFLTSAVCNPTTGQIVTTTDTITYCPAGSGSAGGGGTGGVVGHELWT